MNRQPDTVNQSPDVRHHPVIVAFSGPAGCGKDFAAQKLTALTKPGVIFRFAQPMLDMMQALFIGAGGKFQDWHAYAAKNKEDIIPELGVSYRRLMQTLGTEWGRTCHGPDFWVNIYAAKCLSWFSQHPIGEAPTIFTPDARFANEAEVVKKLGGYVVRINCATGLRNAGNHVSEAGIPDHLVDLTITNDKTPAFAKDLESLYAEIQQKEAGR